MTDERDPLQELGALLDVEPSAAFAAHVRQAIDRAAPRRFNWRGIAIAGMGVAAAGLVVSLAFSRHAPAPVAAPAVARVANRSAPVVETPATVPAVPSKAHDTHDARAHRTRATTGDVVDRSPVVTTTDGHDVIVPADQRLALARLVSGVRAGRFRVPERRSPKYDADGLLLPLEPVAISAIPDPIPGAVDPPATAHDPRGSQKERR